MYVTRPGGDSGEEPGAVARSGDGGHGRRDSMPVAPPWAALAGAVAGEVVLPTSPRYDAVRKPANPRFYDVRPQAVVRCVTPADVAETATFAGRAGRGVAVCSGGRCFARRSSTGDIVIDTPMNSVSAGGDRALIGAGARLGQVYDALQEQGVTIRSTAKEQ